jgi:hypothetical protein
MFAPWSKQSAQVKDADPGLDLAVAEIKAAWAARRGFVEITEDPDWRRLWRPPSVFATTRGLVDLGAELPSNLPADDHGSLWQPNGRPVVWASHPYQKELTHALPAMLDTAIRYGLTFDITAGPAWHNPYACVLVLWRAKSSR